MNACDNQKRIIVFQSLAVLLMGFLITTGAATSDRKSDQKLRFIMVGLSTEVIEADVNENDALVAAQAWVAQMGDTLWNDAQSVLLPDFTKTKELLDEHQLDIIALGTHEYIENSADLAAKPYFTYMYSGSVDLEYVILVHKDSAIKTVEDLEDARLALLERGRYCLAQAWLDVFLMQNRHMGKEIKLQERRVVNKTSQAILPVFFSQLDAALVVRSAFEMACTLNPQIKENLRIIASSPPFVPIVVCLRNSLDSAQKSELYAKGLKLHESVRGLQTFTVFKMDRIVAWENRYENNVKHLLDEHKRLMKSKLDKTALQTEVIK